MGQRGSALGRWRLTRLCVACRWGASLSGCARRGAWRLPARGVDVVARPPRDELAVSVVGDHFDGVGVVAVFLWGAVPRIVKRAVAQPGLWQEPDEDAEGTIGAKSLTQWSRHPGEVDRRVTPGAVLVLVEDPHSAHVRARKAGDLDASRVGRIKHRALPLDYRFADHGRWKPRIAAELRTDLPHARVRPFDVQALPDAISGRIRAARLGDALENELVARAVGGAPGRDDDRACRIGAQTAARARHVDGGGFAGLGEPEPLADRAARRTAR